MNKKIVLLPFVAFSLLLAGCGPAAKSESSASVSSSTSSSASSSSSSEKTPTEYLAEFLAKLEPVNATVKVSVNSKDAFTSYFYSAYGFYTKTDDSSNGVLANGSQGLFDFSYDANGDVVLGQAEAKQTAVTAVYYTPDLLAFASEYFTYSGTWGHFTIEKDEYGNYPGTVDNLLGLATLGDYKDELSSVALAFDDDLLEGAFTMVFTTGTVVMTINEIGTTTNSHFDAYMAKPVTVVAPTDFTADFKKAATDLFGATGVIPFPTDATVLFRDDVLYDDNEKVDGISFDEFSGDLTTSYKNALTKAGYTLGADGESYLFRIVEASEKSDGTFISAALTYDEDNEYTEVKFTLDVAPKTYEGTDFTKINELLTAFNDKKLVSIPLLTASTDVTKTVTADSALATGGTLQASVAASIADKTKAKAYGAAYIALLTNDSFTASFDQWNDLGMALYTSGNAMVLVAMETNDSGDYAGTISLTFAYSAE